MLPWLTGFAFNWSFFAPSERKGCIILVQGEVSGPVAGDPHLLVPTGDAVDKQQGWWITTPQPRATLGSVPQSDAQGVRAGSQLCVKGRWGHSGEQQDETTSTWGQKSVGLLGASHS